MECIAGFGTPPKSSCMYYIFCLGAMSRKPKAIFTTEETVQLTGLFDAGLDSVSKEKAEAIKNAAQKLNKTEQEIKVCMCVYL